MSGVLKVAVIGHTNTGKTSLLRTLTRDVGFGEVSDRPATTRHVEGTSVAVRGRTVMELYDTPGLEDSIALLDHLHAQAKGRRVEGLELIERFLKSREARDRFGQEAKALRQVLAGDVVLYVVDARDRVLGKHRDELQIISYCATPVVPVLNFTADPEARIAIWREHLSRVSMHAVAEFDTVVFDEVSEQRLYEKMRTLLDDRAETFDALIEDRRRQRASLVRGSAELMADLLIDVAACVVPVPVDASKKDDPALVDLRDRVRGREQRSVEQLLELHRFRAADYEAAEIPTVDGRFGLDLFSPEAVKQFGLQTGGAAAVGAMAGLVLDVMSHGVSLGAGTAAGATIGGLIGSGRSFGPRLIRRARGQTELRCDDTTIRLVALRQIDLVRALLRRGHAAVTPLKRPTGRRFKLPARPGRLPAPLEQAKTRPRWSGLLSPAESDPGRQNAQHALVTMIVTQIERPPEAEVDFGS